MFIVYKGQKKNIPEVFAKRLIKSGKAELFQEKPAKAKPEKPAKTDTEK